MKRRPHPITGQEPKRPQALTHAEMQAQADREGFPGPSVLEHAEGYDGPCFCQLCLSYGDS
jgi:hypothetical protein